MTTLRERFAQLAKAKPELKQADIARAAGAKPPSVNAWFSGETKSMRAETAARVAHLYGVNARWLATGEGSMTDQAAEAAKIAAFASGEKVGTAPASEGEPVGQTPDLFPPVSDNAGVLSIPTKAPLSPANLTSAVQLLGSLVGALDQRRRKALAGLLTDLTENPDEVDDIAALAGNLVNHQRQIVKSDELHRALSRPPRVTPEFSR